MYIEYHESYNPCKQCIAKNSARYYQANKEKIIAKSKLCQADTKYKRKFHTQEIEELDKN